MRRLLSATQRFLRIDLRYAVSGGFYLSLSQVASAVIGLALVIAFANLLPPETYGTYRYVLSVYAILAIAALPGIDTAIIRAVSHGNDAAYGEGVRAKLKWGLLGTGAAILVAGYEFLRGEETLAQIFVIVAIVLPFMESLNVYTSFLNGKKIYKEWALIEITSQVVSGAALIATMFMTQSLIALMAAYFIPYVISRLVATFYVRKRFVANRRSDADLFTYGRSLTLFQIISRLIASIDQIILFHFLGPVQVALFALATAVPHRMQSMLRISGTLAFPRFANRTGKEIARSLPRKMGLFFVAILFLCLIYAAAAPYLFEYLFPNYLPSLSFSQVAVFYTLAAVTYPFGSYLFSHKKVRENYLLVIGSGAAKLACLIILVPKVGIWGAVIGLLAASFVTIACSLYYLVREMRA